MFQLLMRPMLALLVLLAVLLAAAPAQATAERPRCTKRIVLVQDSVRVAKFPGGGFLACQGRSRKSYELGPARAFETAGRYLTFVDGRDRLIRLDIRSGDRRVLDSDAGDYRLVGQMRIGHVAWASDGELRFHNYYEGATDTLTAGDAATFAFGENVTPYWREGDAVLHADYDQAWPGSQSSNLPRHQRSERPRCKRNLVLLRKPVRVVQIADHELLACAPDGSQHELGSARNLRAAGPWLTYIRQAGDDIGFVALNVLTGDRRLLNRPESTFAFVGGMLADGTVAWTELDYSDTEAITTLRVLRPSAEAPVDLDRSVVARSDGADGIDPGSVALSADGWVYWRDAAGTVRGAAPPG